MPDEIALLEDRSVLTVSGEEADAFLQDLVTADMKGLEPGAATYAGLLTPQGKVLFDFFILREAEGYLLDCSAANAADLLKRLLMYKLRRKLTIEQLEDLAVAAAWANGEPPVTGSVIAYRDPRHAGLGYRLIGPPDTLAALAGSTAGTYHNRRIALGIADSDRDIGSGEVFPHEANMDQLGGVSFKKGCFVGQEVVSRMEHRGTARSRFLPFRLSGGDVAPGTGITANDRKIGTVTSAADGCALALVRLDRMGSAIEDGQSLNAGAAVLRPVKPDWARFDVPGADD